MTFSKLNDEVLVSSGPLALVTREEIALVKQGAEAGPRGRMRLCAHRSVEDSLHEMLIALRRGTYIRPHKHVAKVESAHVIEGSVDVVLFDETGAVSDVIAMGAYSTGRTFYYRMDEPRFHTLLIRSELLIFHEVTNGPFRRKETVFAPWSPEENDVDAAAAYLETLNCAVNAFRACSPPELAAGSKSGSV
jgi:cupin fold WbuC family metalloprotein